MGRIFSINFWIQAFMSTFMTMLIMYVIKIVAGKYKIPVVSNVAENV